jgi:hypothetical protein
MLEIPGLITLSLTIDDIDFDWDNRNNAENCPIGQKIKNLLPQISYITVSIEKAYFRCNALRYEYLLSRSLVELNKDWAHGVRQHNTTHGFAYLKTVRSINTLEWID